MTKSGSGRKNKSLGKRKETKKGRNGLKRKPTFVRKFVTSTIRSGTFRNTSTTSRPTRVLQDPLASHRWAIVYDEARAEARVPRQAVLVPQVNPQEMVEGTTGKARVILRTVIRETTNPRRGVHRREISWKRLGT